MPSLNQLLHLAPVITGMGAFSAAGKNSDALWQSALQRTMNVSYQQLIASPLSLPVYKAQTPIFSGRERALVRHADRSTLFALAAAREAWEHAGLHHATIQKRNRIGVIVGTSRGPTALVEQNSTQNVRRPTDSLYSTLASTAGILSKVFKIEGYSAMVSSTCTSGATALHAALQMIRSGLLDVVLVGGVEAPITNSILEQYLAAGILSTQQPSKSLLSPLSPFHSERSGTVLGEGAAFVVLESKAFAQQRHAPLLAELSSVALHAQADQRTGLDPEGNSLQQALQYVFQEAGILSSDLDLLHLHGTGTRLNDEIEERVVTTCFGGLERQPFCWATKAITGHTLGASALFQVVLTLAAMRSSKVPATLNSDPINTNCMLHLKGSAKQEHLIRRATCLTSGFWGNTSAILLSK